MEKLKEYLISPEFWISVVTLILSVVVWKILRVFLRKILNIAADDKMRKMNFRVVITVIKSAYVLLIAAVILQINGINIGTLFAGLGVAGIIVGFALQDILKDLMMGVSIVWDQFFAVGDYICYNGKEGKVIDFNAKVTKIESFADDTVYTISNRNITEVSKASSLVTVTIPTPYEEPLPHVKKALDKIVSLANELPMVEEATLLGTDEFADSSINYKVLLRCTDPSKKGAARRAALGIVQEVFFEENISIPYPKMDVTIMK